MLMLLSNKSFLLLTWIEVFDIRYKKSAFVGFLLIHIFAQVNRLQILDVQFCTKIQ